MDLFGTKKRAEERKVLEDSLILLTARVISLEAVAFGVLVTLPEQRNATVGAMREFVADSIRKTPTPSFVSKENLQKYRDEVSRVMQSMIKIIEALPPHSS